MVRTTLTANQTSRASMRTTIWCSGCTLGKTQTTMMSAALKVIAREQGLDLDKPKEVETAKNLLEVVGGIGCTSRMPGHVDASTLHTTHGRALAFATGLQMSKPKRKVVVTMGDGDALAIGGNHFIHAARRNVDVTAIVFINDIYGMTGGQHAPTTIEGMFAASAPFTVYERPFDRIALAKGAGATFIAQLPVDDVRPEEVDFRLKKEELKLEWVMEQAIAHQGFSVVFVLGTCHTAFGKLNDMDTVEELLARIHADIKAGRTPVGILHHDTLAKDILHSDAYAAAIEKARAAKKSAEKLLAALPEIEDPLQEFPTQEMRIAGSGGQGVITAGLLVAMAAEQEGKVAVYRKSYGPEARGGACRSDVITSAGPIYYPEAEELNLLLALTQESLDKYADQVAPGGVIVADSSQVTDTSRWPGTVAAPFTELVRTHVGPRYEVVTNVAGLACAARLTGLMNEDHLTAVATGIKPKFARFNQIALDIGFAEADRIKREQQQT